MQVLAIEVGWRLLMQKAYASSLFLELHLDVLYILC